MFTTMSDKKKEIFDGIWEQLSQEDRNVIVTEHLKSLPKWDLKRVLCEVLSVDNYMDDAALKQALESVVWTR